MSEPIPSILSGAPQTFIHPDRASMGQAAAEHVVALLSHILTSQARARIIFACAPSQDQFLERLIPLSESKVDWSRVTAFHMDEYVGLEASHPANFRSYLREHLLSRIGLGEFHLIAGEAPDPDAECKRYAALIDAAPIDLICLGIGENGHLAFNDPPVADFWDAVSAKVVELDHACRLQQVNDGCFPKIEDVPRQAITLTLPVFSKALYLSVVVPGERKSAAVEAACRGPVGTECPASILRTRKNVALFLDRASASGLKG